jgi:hypothetical protein
MLFPLLRRIHTRMHGSWALLLSCTFGAMLVVVPMLTTIVRTCFHIDAGEALTNLMSDVRWLVIMHYGKLALVGGLLALYVLLECSWEWHRNRMSTKNINRFAALALGDDDTVLDAWLSSPRMKAIRRAIQSHPAIVARRNSTHD